MKRFAAWAPGLLFALALTVTAAVPAWAGPGHDHGDAPAAAVGSASPRVAANSDLFEAVGIVQGKTMTIYLDRYTDNTPVVDAKIEVDLGSVKVMAAAQADGTYLISSDLLAKLGSLPVTMTVTAGEDVDLLAGDLVIGPADDHAHGASSTTALPGDKRLWWAAGGGLGVLAAAALALAWRGKRRHGGAALAPLALATFTAALLASTPPAAQAGPGHDHGDEPAAAAGNAPKRQPDGRIFLPKPSQRQLGIRTLTVEEKSLPRSEELNGRVVMDPNAGGKVQPTLAGRVEAGPAGLPMLGQAVQRGQALAVVRASINPLERASQAGAGAELRAQLQSAQRNLERLQQLEGSVPQREIDAARIDVDGLKQRLSAQGSGVDASETVRAPVSGVIAAVNVVSGQVVDARELMFEIVDPARLLIEASAFDGNLAAQVASASAVVGVGSALPLRFVGAGRTLRDGALPLQFRTLPAAAGQALPVLAVGQLVKVIVQTKAQVVGLPVPMAAVVKSPSNLDVVWVHTAAETFEPRPVRWAALDGASVSVLAGLKPGERVVVQGAPLLNQVR
jgi:membrane fusion protein, heavy metal efflux system